MFAAISISDVALPKRMQTVTVHPNKPITTSLEETAVPSSLQPNEVLIQVYAAASNPKDYLHVIARNISINSGDDLAGIVAKTGSEVTTCSVGDRVAAFHPMSQAFGAYAEYAVAPAHTVFKIPEWLSYEEASTIPLVSLTASLTLFRRQGYIPPWKKESASENGRPLLIYGASSALGTFTIKLAKLANVGPIIAVGGGSSEYAKSLLDLQKMDRDVFLDYRMGMAQVTSKIQKLATTRGWNILNAIDAVNVNSSWVDVSQMVAKGGRLSVFSGAHRYDDGGIKAGVEILYTFVGTGHLGKYLPGMPKQPLPEETHGDIEFGTMFYRYLTEILAAKAYEGHPFEVIPGGLSGVQEGLRRLQDGKAAGKKFVYRLRDETED